LGKALGRRVAGEDLLSFIESGLVDDRRMLAGIARLAVVDDPADRPSGRQRAQPRDDLPPAQVPYQRDQ
jgi:hypothetical protein